MAKPIDDALRKAIQSSGISAKKMAAATEVPQTTISRFLRGHEMSSGKMAKIAAYLGLELK